MSRLLSKKEGIERMKGISISISKQQELEAIGAMPKSASWRRTRAISDDEDEVGNRNVRSKRTYIRRFSFNVGITPKQILSPTSTIGRKTKIVCAIGPSCWSKDMLGKLLDAGMNVARLNFSHGDHEMHGKSLMNLRAAMEERPGCYCAVLLDTKGPEIRTGLLKNHKSISLKIGQQLDICTDDTYLGDEFRISCSYKHLPSSVHPGSVILCADGAIVMKVLSCEKDFVRVEVQNNCILEERKNMNLPGASIRIPGITEKDVNDIVNFGLTYGVDIVSGSFVRCAENVKAIRDCLGQAGRTIRVHAKIESIEALRNIDEILEVADGVHVSRGDLGMELEPQQVFLAQKMIIRTANIMGKPVVTSTQMLQSMTKSPNPTSAECSDVANAVIDGTDCVMLSGETAKGSYPVRAVETMSRICAEAEDSLDYEDMYHILRQKTPRPVSVPEAVASSAVETAIDMKAKLIISFSETGRSAKYIAKYRPRARILAITASATTARQLEGLSRGITSYLVGSMIGTDSLIIRAIDMAKDREWIDNGDVIVVVHGTYEAKAGETNIVKVIEARPGGYSSPINALSRMKLF